MKSFCIGLLFLFPSVLICQYAFDELNTSRYARTVGLGNAFTGLADDIEAVYYNSAGLANLDYYSVCYSKGNGYAFFVDDYVTDDFSLLIPTFKNIGTFALSLDRWNTYDSDFGGNLFRLHYARNIFTNFSVGASFNYYHLWAKRYSMVSEPYGISHDDLSGNAFDISVSVLYCLQFDSPGVMSNQTRFGMQMQNVLDTDLHYNNDLEDAPKHQTFRLGASSSFIPDIEKIANLTPVKLTGLFDAVFYGWKYKFDVWQPNFGIELLLFDIVSLRYGRENEKEIKEAYSYSPQHPVKRYGAGFKIPLDKLLLSANKIELAIDYSSSDWDKLDESKPLFSYTKEPPVRDAWSAKLSFNF